MIRIVKLHLGLIKFIYIELKKKRTIQELIKFFRNLIGSYLKELLKLYKQLFDMDYRKQQAEYKKYQQAKKEIVGLIKLLRYSKDKLKKAGLSRQRIKRFFIDLGSRDDEALQKLCDELMKEIGE